LAERETCCAKNARGRPVKSEMRRSLAKQSFEEKIAKIGDIYQKV